MPSYRIEALVRHPRFDHEDKLEQKVLRHLYDIDCSGVEIVAFRVFPNGG